MTTYHGITKVECRKCGYTSTDDTEMELWNDYGVPCVKCDGGTTVWTQEDGSEVITGTDSDGNPTFPDA